MSRAAHRILKGFSYAKIAALKDLAHKTLAGTGAIR